MSCSANGSATKYFYVVEVNGAIPAAAAWLPIRYTSSSLQRETTQIDSNEIRADRQRPLSRQGTYSTQGEISAELSKTSFDGLLEIAMQGTWATNTLKIGTTSRSIAILERHTDIENAKITATTISALGSDDSFNDSANGFVTAGFKVGDHIVVSGFTTVTANNATFKIASVAAGKITVTNPDGTVATAIADRVAGDSVTILAAVDFVYRGCYLNGFNVSADIDAPVAITFPVVGREADAYAVPSAHTFAAPATTGMMVTSQGQLDEAGVEIAYVTQFNFSLTNNMAPTFSLFQRAAFCVSNGVAMVSGALSAYLKDGRLYGKHLNETETTFVARYSDGPNTHTFTFPKVLLTQGSKGVPGPGALIPQYSFSAGYDATALTTMQIERSV